MNTEASAAANRVANLMARSESFAFRLAALNAMGGERASYPAGERVAKGKPKPKARPLAAKASLPCKAGRRLKDAGPKKPRSAARAAPAPAEAADKAQAGAARRGRARGVLLIGPTPEQFQRDRRRGGYTPFPPGGRRRR